MSLKLKRVAKKVRNAVRDPLPRRRTLHFCRVDVLGNAVVFHYQAKSRDFTSKVLIPDTLTSQLEASKDKPAVRNALVAIGLALAPRLFRLSDFSTVQLDSLKLDEQSVSFFEEFFVGGLAESRYRQGLDPRRHVSIVADRSVVPHLESTSLSDHALLLNGGGKDTVVAAEMLLACQQPFTWLTIAPNATRRRVIQRSGNLSALEVDFEMGDELLSVREAYGWGHTPYAAIVMAIGTLIALLTGSKYVISGNESSADLGNTVYRNHPVNHQYSKSSEFEVGFWNFVRRAVHPEMEVISLLRPFRDLELTHLFASFGSYFADFVSCNDGIASGKWCWRCPKCAFTALSVGAFVGLDRLKGIFGEDVLNRVAMREWINELVGGSIKPWECVGDKDECRLALALLLEREPTLDFGCRPRRCDWERMVSGTDVAGLKGSILEQTSDRHLLPEGLRVRVNDVLSAWDCGSARVRPSAIRPAGRDVSAVAPHVP